MSAAFALLLVGLAVAPRPAPAAETDTLTVITLNLWNDQGDWPRRLAKILAGLRALHPDVVCLQEVLQHATLRNQAATIADSLGFHTYFASVDSVTRVKRYGNAIVTPHRILLAEGKELEPRDDYRTVAHVRIDFRGRAIDVYDTHLHHTSEGGAIRATQIADLLAYIAATRGPGALVLAGDFNAASDAPEMRPLAPAFVDGYPVVNPGRGAAETTTLNPAFGHSPRQIDHVFVPRAGRPALVPLTADLLFRDAGPDSIWASDHFGVVVRLAVVR